MENENRKRQVIKKRQVTKNRSIKVDRSKNSELASGKPLCSVCQASGKMIATLSSELAPGVTLVLDRRAFVGSSIKDKLSQIDWDRLEFIPTIQQLIVLDPKTLKKWQEDHVDVE